MSDRFVRSHIHRLPLFKNLPPDQLDQMSEAFQVIRFEPGETIFQQGQAAQGLVYFVSGRAVIIQVGADRQQQQVGAVGQNQFLNQDALFATRQEPATLYVTNTAIVLFLSRQRFLNLLASNPAIEPNLGIERPVFQPPPPPNPPPGTQPPTYQPTRMSPPPNNGYDTAPRPGMPHVPSYRRPPAPQQNTATPTNTPQQQPPSQSPAPAAPDAPPIAQDDTFPGKRPGERVILKTRRHWWTVVVQSWLPLLIAVLIFIASAFLEDRGVALLLDVLVFILPGAMLVYNVINYLDDWLIVTNQRVLHLEQNRLRFQNRLQEIPVRSIQSVNGDFPANDVFARIYTYGNLEVNTAGSQGNIAMSFIPDPDGKKDIIINLRSGIMREEELEKQQQAIRAALDATMGRSDMVSNVEKDAPPPPDELRAGPLATRFINSKGSIVYRKHVVFWMRRQIVPIMILLGSLLLLVVAGAVEFLRNLGFVVPMLSVFGFIVGGLWFYYNDWDWRNDLYILGKSTITLIRKRPFFAQDEDDEILIDRIDSTSFRRNGWRARLFNYGDVIISLLGESKNRVFHNVRAPESVREEISNMKAAYFSNRQAAELQAQRQAIAQTIKTYHDEYGGQINYPGVPADPSTNVQPTYEDRQRPGRVPRRRN